MRRLLLIKKMPSGTFEFEVFRGAFEKRFMDGVYDGRLRVVDMDLNEEYKLPGKWIRLPNNLESFKPEYVEL